MLYVNVYCIFILFLIALELLLRHPAVFSEPTFKLRLNTSLNGGGDDVFISAAKDVMLGTRQVQFQKGKRALQPITPQVQSTTTTAETSSTITSISMSSLSSVSRCRGDSSQELGSNSSLTTTIAGMKSLLTFKCLCLIYARVWLI